jgi:acyl carrier protein
MAKADTFERLKALIIEVCEIPQGLVRRDARIAAYALDSVKETELLCAIEEAFGVKLDDDEARAAKTVEDWVRYVDRLTGKP